LIAAFLSPTINKQIEQWGVETDERKALNNNYLPLTLILATAHRSEIYCLG
jgi:hypothetical protein